MNNWRDSVETLLAVGVALTGIVMIWATISVVIGLSFGLAARAAHWIM